MRRTFRARVISATSAVALVAGLTVALTAGSASAASKSDPRADFHTGTGSINDGNVSGSVEADGKHVNVNDPANGVIIDAVVVKGGPAYNVYSTNSGDPTKGNHVPPAEPTLTRYISPLNGGGNIP